MASSKEADLELEDDTEAYRSNVESSALSTDVILSKIRNGRSFKAALLGTSADVRVIHHLTQEEVERVLSVADIDWESLRRTVLQSIVDNRASTKNSVHIRTRTHVDNVFAKMDSLGPKLPPFMSMQAMKKTILMRNVPTWSPVCSPKMIS